MLISFILDHASIILLCGVIALLLLQLYTAILKLAHIPGPYAARFSNILLTYHDYCGSRSAWLHELHQHYGPVVRISSNEVSFASPEAIMSIYGIGNGIQKDACYELYKLDGKANLFSTLDANTHARQKRVLAPLYTKRAVRRHLPSIEKHADELIMQLDTGSPIDLYKLLAFFTTDNITATVYGEEQCSKSLSFNTHRASIEEELYSGIDYCKFWQKAGYNWFARVTYAVQRIKSLFAGPDPARHEPNLTIAPKSSLVRTLLDAGASTQYIWSEARDHVIAGSDTTTTTLAYLFHALATRRELVQRLREEQDLPMEERPLLEATIKEALRLWSAIPMTLPRVTSKALVIAGIYIPAGVKIGASAYTLHRSPVFEKPDVFEPTRWLAATTAMCRHYWPFSSGSRVCIGQNLAMLEFKVLVSAMIKKFDMTQVGPCDMAQEERVSSFAMLPRGKVLRMQFTRLGRTR